MPTAARAPRSPSSTEARRRTLRGIENRGEAPGDVASRVRGHGRDRLARGESPPGGHRGDPRARLPASSRGTRCTSGMPWSTSRITPPVLEQGQQRPRGPEVLQRLRRHDRLELLDQEQVGAKHVADRLALRDRRHLVHRDALGWRLQVGQRPRIHEPDLPEVESARQLGAARPARRQRLPDRPRRPAELARMDDRERAGAGREPRRGSRPRRSRSG